MQRGKNKLAKKFEGGKTRDEDRG